MAGPADGAVAPAGPYLLFVNHRTDDGLVPSVAAQVDVRSAPGTAVASSGRNASASRDTSGKRPPRTPSVALEEVEAVRTADLAATGAVAVDPAVLDHQHGASGRQADVHGPGHAVELAAASVPTGQRDQRRTAVWWLVPMVAAATVGRRTLRPHRLR